LEAREAGWPWSEPSLDCMPTLRRGVLCRLYCNGGIDDSNGSPEIALCWRERYRAVRQEQRKEANMAKWCAPFFGVIGYLVVIWYYSNAFAPLTWDTARTLLGYMCLSCVSISSLHSSTLRIAFLILGPINAAIYSLVGFVFGKLLLTLNRSHKELPPSHATRH
jgi:hypothetical protein